MYTHIYENLIRAILLPSMYYTIKHSVLHIYYRKFAISPCNNLGFLYVNGYGVKPDFEQTKKL